MSNHPPQASSNGPPSAGMGMQHPQGNQGPPPAGQNLSQQNLNQIVSQPFSETFMSRVFKSNNRNTLSQAPDWATLYS
jgi:hypothetical protein